MIPSFCNDEITVLRAPLVDDRGSKRRDWANATSHTIENCSVQPAYTESDNAERENVKMKWTVYLDADADIKRFDRMVFEDETYEVYGAPYIWKSPSGQTTHKICSLLLTDG